MGVSSRSFELIRYFASVEVCFLVKEVLPFCVKEELKLKKKNPCYILGEYIHIIFS